MTNIISYVCGREGDRLVAFLDTDTSSEPTTFPLTVSPELTEEENFLATLGDGRIRLQSSKVVAWSDMVVLSDEAELHIASAQGLAKCSSFGTGSDPYISVFRSSRSEGGEYKQIHKTRVVPKTLDPVFHKESVKLQVPADEDWSGVSVRLDAW